MKRGRLVMNRIRMTKRLTAVRDDGKAKLFTRPAAASGFTDSESGDDGDGTEQALRALKVMLDRGLMSRADYDERRADILSGSKDAARG